MVYMYIHLDGKNLYIHLDGKNLYIHLDGKNLYLHLDGKNLYLHLDGKNLYLHLDVKNLHIHLDGNEPIHGKNLYNYPICAVPIFSVMQHVELVYTLNLSGPTKNWTGNFELDYAID